MDDVVHDYLKCGDLKEGFARVRCTNPYCHHEYLLAFSCKGRWFCPSCHSKKVVKFGEDVCNNILYPVPHRQFVFSIPILLRVYFKYDRRLLTEFCHCAKENPDKKLIESHNTQNQTTSDLGRTKAWSRAKKLNNQH
ncbi:MAG: hypothetical protein GWP10_07450 [Nitrospiraceae bacterium]|nr:hypothetical protein [Nitrospiraceae bacterium]